MPQLQISMGDGQERVVDLGDRPVWFGRSEENDVVLTEQKASRKHCTFRPLQGGWRVVDEESSNGTWLGGKPVLAARLQPGDEVEIGDTVITFVAQPGELKTPEASRARRHRKTGLPWGALVAGILLAAGAWFGFQKLATEQTARESSAWKHAAQADVQRAGLAKDDDAWRAVLDESARGLLSHDRASDASAVVKNALAAGRPEPPPEAPKAEWVEALERLEAGRAGMSPTERRSRLHDVLARCAADTDGVAAVVALLKGDEGAARERGVSDAARLLAQADVAAGEGSFARAFDGWTAWLAAAPEVSPAEERAVATKMAAARGEARLAAGVALAQYEEQLKEGRVTAAAAAVTAALDRLRGTGWDAWLAARTRRYDAGGAGSGATPSGVAGGPRESEAAHAKALAEERRKRAVETSNGLARTLRLAEAAAAVTEAAAGETDGAAQADLKLRVEDLTAEAAALTSLLAAVRADASKIGVVPLHGGTGRVTGADDATFLVGDPRGANPHPVPLADLPTEAIVKILDKAALDPASLVGVALLCREMGEQGAYTAWMRKALAVEGLQTAASAVHARMLGAAVPLGGYVPHPTDAKSICTFDEKKAIDNAAKIASQTAELAKLVDKIDASKQAKQIQTVAVVYAKLEASRKHALELIFDEVKYFYPYRNRMKEYVPVQKEVDDRVALVKESWEDPVKANVRTDASLEKLMKQADDLRIEIEFLGGRPAALTGKLERMRMYLGKELTVQSFFETPEDLALLEWNKELMDANAKAKNGVADQEREQVRITNEYRRMLGHRRVLRLHEKLVASARGHSDDMSKLGFFDHFNEQNPAKRTPMDRMLLAGYPNRPCSENIHMGSSDAQGAHNGWVHSSGHHRNILMAGWSEMGTGQSGRYWTQNFGFCPGDEQVGGGGPQ